MTFWLGVFIGLAIGACVGFFFAAMLHDESESA